ncbi:unnamed protein product [Toxocara canis]|uniref:Ovule protein n=1 Tax=Toxocara canis TaxID=6265 RepID=A0A183V859_TOXCA|nr:unnamed protein product [Toxocara canis]
MKRPSDQNEKKLAAIQVGLPNEKRLDFRTDSSQIFYRSMVNNHAVPIMEIVHFKLGVSSYGNATTNVDQMTGNKCTEMPS